MDIQKKCLRQKKVDFVISFVMYVVLLEMVQENPFKVNVSHLKVKMSKRNVKMLENKDFLTLKSILLYVCMFKIISR